MKNQKLNLMKEKISFGTDGWRGILGVEMEVAGLFTIAALEGVKALALLTVSDDIVRNKVMSSSDRENTFDEMVTVALGVASNQAG